MKSHLGLGVLLVASTLVVAVSASDQAGTSPKAAAQTQSAATAFAPRPVLDQYCVTCHSQRLKTAGVTLDTVDLAAVPQAAETWEKVLRKLRAGMMPPVGAPRPDAGTYARLTGWLEGELDEAATAHPRPGRTEAFHRLNRAEYRNAVRDLLAVDVDVSILPADDASYGFDNIAGILKVNSSAMEQYVGAARTISRTALGSPLPAPGVFEFRIPDDVPQYQHVDGLPFGTRGGGAFTYQFPQDGEYVISVNLVCRIGGGCDPTVGFVDPHDLEITLDGERVHLATLKPRLIEGPSAPFEVRLSVKAGPHRVAAAFIRLPSIEETEGRRARLMRPIYLGANDLPQNVAIYQPFVDTISITGPFAPTGPGDTPSRRRVFVCRPASAADNAVCARKILTALARRAYRRPVTAEDVDGLLSLYRETVATEGFEAGIEMSVRRLLASPEFLFRVERDPAAAPPGSAYRISDLELASRLSFFLWSSIPDDELLRVAERGQLRNPVVLAQQVRRMLGDRRSRALVTNFVGQWLQLRNLQAIAPSASMFQNFDGALRSAFRQETEMLFESILREGRSVTELLTADYTFVNERLARHYDIPGVYGSQFRRVRLADPNRRGLLGQGSILTVTSRPNRTSPVLRGKWILESILGTPPPPPPPNVPPLKEQEEGSKKVLSMRERMAQHRANPVCAGCHSMIDPAGFVLENFDAIGRWREVDEAYAPIDPSGMTPDGRKFGSLAEFKAALLSKPDLFAATVTEKLLIYALGRGLAPSDMPAVRQIVRAASPGLALSTLVARVAISVPFTMREAPAPAVSVAAR